MPTDTHHTVSVVTDEVIKRYVIEAMAGHLGQPVSYLEGLTVVSDGIGRHMTWTDRETFILHHAEDQLFRAVGDQREIWFRGSRIRAETVQPD